MTYRLDATNGDSLELTVRDWGWMLDAGVGLPFGCAPSLRHTRLAFDERGRGSPVTNDGYAVYSREAAACALVARGLASVYAQAQISYDRASHEERVRALHDPRSRLPVPAAKLEVLRAFAEFAERSGGFTIC